MGSAAVVPRNQNPNEKEESRVSTALDNVAVFPVPAQEEPQEEQRKKDNDGLHKRRGIWHTRVKIDGKWRELSLETRNYKEARKNRPEKIQEFEERQKLPDLANLHFEKAAELWLGERLKLVARGAYKIEKQRLAPLVQKFGKLEIVQITAQHLPGYPVICLEQGSSRTVNLGVKVAV